MIVVQLRGGLGNQLFQYAAGFSLAYYHNVPVLTDVSLLEDKHPDADTRRQVELTKFNCSIEIATAETIQQLTRKSSPQYWLNKLKPAYRRTVYREQSFVYDENFFKAGSKVYLEGYRQSEKYFEPVKNEILQIFTIKEELVASVKNTKEHFQQQQSVAVHIRRKDYLLPAAKAYHGVLDAAYYKAAMVLMTELVENPVFYIFSDDADWVKENIAAGANVNFITAGISNTAIADFHLISSCKHQIIANSTFSWWAAYLNPNPGKIVIAPKKWFNKAPCDTKDLIPPNWIRI